MSTRRAVTCWCALLLVACGGVVERGSGDSETGGAGAPAELPPQVSDPSDEPAGGLQDPNADTELGECVLGYPETFSQPCAWVGERRCYDTRQMACNCICPRDRDSQCVSGFEVGPDGHTWVACS